MLRLFLILSLCVVFWACSSDDDSAALDEWFKSHGIASSYSLTPEDIPLSFESTSRNPISAYMVVSSAALGNANGIEQMLYFGLEVSGSPSPVWNLRTDSVFYADFSGDGYKKSREAEFYWRVDSKTEHDTTWLKFEEEFTDTAKIRIEWKPGETRDTFSISLPSEFLELNADTLRLLAGIKLLDDDVVLRFEPPNTVDIPGLLRVAQKPSISDECKQCLYSVVGDSLSVTFNIKEKIAERPVVFAELIMPKSNDATSELGFQVPVFVNSEDYRVDTAYVNQHKYHPNLVFWTGDSLRLQVTQSLRSYASAANPQNTLDFTLRLGTPMLIPDTTLFFNTSTARVFSDRFALARYDFSSAFAEPVKLRIWFADFGDKK